MSGCVSLSNAANFYATVQSGYLLVRDPEEGKVTPMVATYNSGWLTDAMVFNREPDQVKLWYRAGAMDTEVSTER